MDQLSTIIDLTLNFDQYLPVLIAAYGFWTYAILFLIIFLETGIVVFPFLPGDSLLFVAGALAGKGLLSVEILLITLSIAAILGDTLNYWIGRYFGQKILDMNLSVIRQEHIDKTHFFFEKYGGLTIVIARFIPFVRTFAPFFAGIGRMNYPHFLAYNIIGGVGWVCSFVIAGYLFGNLPIVQDNFSLVILLIIGISLIGVGSIILNMFRSFKITDIFIWGKKD
ncbi:MAG: VTT domain-containing protein [Methanoregulaceae archaeon]|jgi:membrane-associated protein|nr:VTT domain-containing protein [Methanoregulaceae archaeon]